MLVSNGLKSFPPKIVQHIDFAMPFEQWFRDLMELKILILLSEAKSVKAGKSFYGGLTKSNVINGI